MTQVPAYEQLDLLYLGREVDPETDKTTDLPLLIKHKHLTTHAAIIGMTGSGKTGLGIDLLEEAALDQVPSIIIDPKGDMGNLLLTFPSLEPDDFKPWLDPIRAEQLGISLDALATDTAKTWREGLHGWNQDGARIRRLREQAEIVLYTPGSSKGRPVSVLDSLSAPAPELLGDSESLTSLVNAAVSSLLGLLGIAADPLKSREHILLSTILLTAWRQEENLTLPALIGAVMQPSFDKVGIFPLETFFPQAKRMELAMQLNNIIASPAFASWLEGDPFEIDGFLYSTSGKPRLSIFSIAHLDDHQRMFFVTMLLGRLIGWMRRQEGSSGLRGLVYMDEIFGFFPPVGNPPSKTPMLLLLKQARAFGLGIVLSTQNPVDLDYKGLANIGTWFIGRLQTKQDQDRVMTGISGDAEQHGASQLRKWLGAMQPRQFLLYSAHREEVVRFEARWAMSYLKGPMSLAEIARLQDLVQLGQTGAESVDTVPSTKGSGADSEFNSEPPFLAGSVMQRFVPSPVPMAEPRLHPWLAGVATLRFMDQRRGIDQEEVVVVRLPLAGTSFPVDWSQARSYPVSVADLVADPPDGAQYAEIPAELSGRRDFKAETAEFADFLYRSRTLVLRRVPTLKLESRPEEDERQFRLRIAAVLGERKEQEADSLEERYAGKLRQVEARLEKARARAEKERGDVQARGLDAAMTIGVAVFGALFGRKPLSVSTASRTASGMRSAGRLVKEKGDVARAEQEVERLEAEFNRLNEELQAKLAELNTAYDPRNYPDEEFFIKPRRADVYNEQVFVLWEPDLPFSSQQS